MILADLAFAEQLYELRGVLPDILAGLHTPAPTAVVAGRVARKLNCEPSLASALLMRVTAEFGATHDGDVIYRYGKRMQRWRWHPRLGRPAINSPAPLTAEQAGEIERELDRLALMDETPEVVAKTRELYATRQAYRGATPVVDTEDW